MESWSWVNVLSYLAAVIMDTTVVCSQCVRTRMNLKAAHTPADTNTTRVSQKKTLRPKCQNDESRYRKLDLKRRLHTFQRFTAAHTHTRWFVSVSHSSGGEWRKSFHSVWSHANSSALKGRTHIQSPESTRTPPCRSIKHGARLDFI